MDGNQEHVLNLEAKKLQGDSKPLFEPVTIEQPAKQPIAERINEIKTGTQTCLQRANLFLSDEPKTSEGHENKITQDEVSLRFEELREKEAITPEEYIERSNLALRSSAVLQQQICEEKEALEGTIRQKDTRWQIERRIQELNKAKGLKRISGYLEKRRLAKQKTGVDIEKDALVEQIHTKKDQLVQLREQEKPIRQNIEELQITELIRSVEAIKNNYEQILGEIIEDGSILSEIRESYVKEVISPYLEIPVYGKNLSTEEKEEFYQTLNDYLDHRNSPQDERQRYITKLDKLLTGDLGYRMNYGCQVLINEDDIGFVKLLTANMAADDIDKIWTGARQYFSGAKWETYDRFFQSFRRTMEPDSDTGEKRNKYSLGPLILANIVRDKAVVFPNMDLWQGLRESSTANQIFGEQIKKQDQLYYQTALDKSLSDDNGGYINQLRYYPTIDSIRNLILIAAADVSTYRTVHANESLSVMAKKPGWRKRLDEIEIVFPSLRSARQVLESWDYEENGNQPDIQEVIGDFALAIIESKPTDERLVDMATESLTNGSIASILAKRGDISREEATILKEAEICLKRIDEETEARHKENDFSVPYIDSYSFGVTLRKNLFKVLETLDKPKNETTLSGVKKFILLAKEILQNNNNYQVVDYLTERVVINRLNDPTLKTEVIPIFLKAYQSCPALLYPPSDIIKNNFVSEFCQQFEGEQTVTYFRDLDLAYKEMWDQVNEIVISIGRGEISKGRALELPTKAKQVLTSPQFPLANEFPQLFLESDNGTNLFVQTTSSGLYSVDYSLGIWTGQRIRELEKSGKLNLQNLLISICSPELRKINELLSADTPLEVNQNNWQQLLMGFVRSKSGNQQFPALSEKATENLNTLFDNPKTWDLCLNGLRNQWQSYLKSGKPEEIPFSLTLTSEFINYCTGAGPLSQIESLNSLILATNRAFSLETTTEETKTGICQGMALIEERFIRERWSNEDRTDYYNISRDILEADPSLFTDFLELFEKLTPNQMKLLVRDIYPLYRTKLVLLEEKDIKGQKTYDKEQLLYIKHDIGNFTETLKSEENQFENQKQKLTEEIKSLFKSHFGIIKIPQEFNSEHIRSITNVSNYLANLHDRNPEREAILGFYLSLILNGRWDDFRKGQYIDAGEFLTAEKGKIINSKLQERQSLSPLTAEKLGITKEEVPEFLELLQLETQNIVLGNIETIDIKLSNIIQNLRGLVDFDLYNELIDKQKLQLLLGYGNKIVGSTVAKMYQSLANPGRSIKFAPEEIEIQNQVTQMVKNYGLELTKEVIKEQFQIGLRPLATVVNLFNFIEETQAESGIELLRGTLKPSPEIIVVFKRLGEDFKPTSGAMALTQDLSYLDNLVIKRENELTPEEKTKILSYITGIRGQVIKLEEIYDQIKNKFNSFKQGNTSQDNSLLQEKLIQIDGIINAKESRQVITSTTTNNLNIIIENIRECLSASKEGFNNDTDLTFGDMNKFYVFSQSESKAKGSISDQIAFVEPILREDGTTSVAIVLDRIYETNTPTILENQIDAVLKKYRVIKQRFPNIRFSIFVPGSTIGISGWTSEALAESFKTKNVTAKMENVEVDVTGSAMGDHYIEFGGSPRTAGKRKVSGLLLSL